MSNPALLQCPFCGSRPRIELGKRGSCQLHGEPFQSVLIRCAKYECPCKPKCEAGDIFNGGKELAEKEAIAKWNNRTPDPELKRRADMADELAKQLRYSNDIFEAIQPEFKRIASVSVRNILTDAVKENRAALAKYREGQS